jgi:hypothetical protein
MLVRRTAIVPFARIHAEELERFVQGRRGEFGIRHDFIRCSGRYGIFRCARNLVWP